MTETVRRNSARCLDCGDNIESTHRHDMVWCRCGNVAVDGGRDYRRRAFHSDRWVDTSDYDPDDPTSIEWGVSS